MIAIYEPKGAAREYAELAVNLYQGCPHRCSYCYAPSCLRKSREDFATNIGPRPGILKAIERDADSMVFAEDHRVVTFSFTSDPYGRGRKPEDDITRQALQIMVERCISFDVLTKGGSLAERDFDLLKRGGSFGTSIVWNHDPIGFEWEPYAASVYERLTTMARAHKAGIWTWLSVEPVINPDEALGLLRYFLLYPDCDEFRIGKLNHAKDLEAKVDWQEFTTDCYDLLLETGKRFMFKSSLHPYLQGRPATGGPQ